MLESLVMMVGISSFSKSEDEIQVVVAQAGGSLQPNMKDAAAMARSSCLHISVNIQKLLFFSSILVRYCIAP